MAKLTNAAFAEQCAYLAKNAAAWAGDCLTLPEYNHRPVDPTTVARFTDDMRNRLDRLDERAGRLALADKTSPPLSPVARAGKEQP